MSTNLKTISKWLDERELKHSYDKEREVITFGIKDNVQTYHFIRLLEDGDMFSYQIQLIDDNMMVQIPQNHQYIDTILKYLLKKNHSIKFGCWEYNFEDGDIRYAIEIPLEDADMTERQFERVLTLSINDVDLMFKGVLDILKTGEMPEEKDESFEMLKKLALLEALEDGTLDKLFSELKEDDESGI